MPFTAPRRAARAGDRCATSPSAAPAEAERARARGAAAPGAEDGGHRPAHRRHRARLQQHPHQRHRLPRAGARSAPSALGDAPLAAPARPGAARRAARARPDRADARLRAAPARRAPRAGRWRRWCARRCSCCARPCRRSVDDRRSRPTMRAPLVEADAVQLEQVLFNLCINARDAIDGAGHDPHRPATRQRRMALRVVPRAVAAGALGRAEVADSGSGIAPDTLRAHVRALLHDQGGRQRLGHGTGDGARHRPRPRRPRRRATTAPQAGPVFRVLLPPARATPAAPAPRAPRRSACRRARSARPRAAGRRRGAWSATSWPSCSAAGGFERDVQRDPLRRAGAGSRTGQASTC